jgi:hypothetical protein
MDGEIGDLVLSGLEGRCSHVLAEIASHSTIADGESVVRLAARMRQIILEAVNDSTGAPVRRTDRGHKDLGRAFGDA